MYWYDGKLWPLHTADFAMLTLQIELRCSLPNTTSNLSSLTTEGSIYPSTQCKNVKTVLEPTKLVSPFAFPFQGRPAREP